MAANKPVEIEVTSDIRSDIRTITAKYPDGSGRQYTLRLPLTFTNDDVSKAIHDEWDSIQTVAGFEDMTGKKVQRPVDPEPDKQTDEEVAIAKIASR